MTKMRDKFSRSKKYRGAFVESYLKRSIPYQITALRKKAGLSQEQLAEASGLTQGVVSRAENPNYGNLTLNTVLRIAGGLNVAFVGEFVSFRELEERVDHLAERTASMSNFKDEEAEDRSRSNRSIAVVASSYGSGKTAAALNELLETYEESVLVRIHHSETLRQEVLTGLHDPGHGIGFACGSVAVIGEQINPAAGIVRGLGEQGLAEEYARIVSRQREAGSLRAFGPIRGTVS
jgi:transcriptional regulator with XRE-family HTH domain